MKTYENKPPLLWQYFVLVCFIYILYNVFFILLCDKDGIVLIGIHLCPLLCSLVLNYLFSCFWIKKMLLYDDKIEIIYPTRFFYKKYTLSYNMITKVVFTDIGKEENHFIIYTKKANCHQTIKSGSIDDVKQTMQFFRNKGIELEYKLIDSKDIKKYTND